MLCIPLSLCRLQFIPLRILNFLHLQPSIQNPLPNQPNHNHQHSQGNGNGNVESKPLAYTEPAIRFKKWRGEQTCGESSGEEEHGHRSNRPHCHAVLLRRLRDVNLSSCHGDLPPLGSNIDNEGVAPCGGFTPSASENATYFHVEGDAIGLTTLHAQAFFAYRGMLGISVSSTNWTILLPTVEEFGLNNFCEPSVAVPPSWAGSGGLLQIIQDSEDGVHYQVCSRSQLFQCILWVC